MGGFGSTRWNGKRARQDIDPLLSLDVRWLKRQGALEPGVVARHVLNGPTSRGEPSGDIVTVMERSGEALTLDYRVRRIGESTWVPIRDRVRIERTPCHFGGVRVWFRCPGCESRRAVLFSVGGRFKCRDCNNVAYSSSREDRFERAHRRIRLLQKRLGANSLGISLLRDVPDKPSGMQWATYRQIVQQLNKEVERYEADLEMKNRDLVAKYGGR